VHRQIFDGDETIEYAFMGQDPDAADNRWLHEAFENQIPIIYFLGIAPGRYQAILSTFISGWDAKALKARVAFGLPDNEALEPPENALERRYALRTVKQRLHQASFREAVITAYNGRCALSGLPEGCFWTPHTSSPTRTSGSANHWCLTESRCRKSTTLPSTHI
jgi:putative restriction endonuclease